MVGLQPLFFCPIVEYLCLRIETAQAILGAQQYVILSIGKKHLDIIGDESAVIFMIMLEIFLDGVIDEQAGVVRPDIQQPVWGLVL